MMSRQLNWFPSPRHILAFLHDSPQSFWLDSGSNVSNQGQRSFYGKNPIATFRSVADRVTISDAGQTHETRGDPIALFTEFVEQQNSLAAADRDDPFSAIHVGYLSYEVGRFTEPIRTTTLDDLGLPEIYFGFYRDYHVVDHQSGEHWQVGEHTSDPESGIPDSEIAAPGSVTNPVVLRSNFSQESYRAAIEEAREYIAAGDIYQVNLSQRFIVPTNATPEELYLAVRDESPAPFGAFLKFPGYAVLSNSPERFLKLDPVTRVVQTRPIKGTRPRGSTPEEDTVYANELLNSEKDRAENIMIVDLERNDLGRVCEPGSVRVTEQCLLEVYPTVFHLTSTVEGIMERDRKLIDLLRATFPGGSITGAPKIRAMQIINELEPTRRGVYTGSLGYIASDGALDLSIAIRTAIYRDGKLFFQVGGGIVADSDPEMEYQETLTKALAWQQALARVQGRLDD